MFLISVVWSSKWELNAFARRWATAIVSCNKHIIYTKFVFCFLNVATPFIKLAIVQLLYYLVNIRHLFNKQANVYLPPVRCSSW